MNEEKELSKCNFQTQRMHSGHIACSLKREGRFGCDEENCRLVKIESTLNEIYRFLMDEYMKEAP